MVVGGEAMVHIQCDGSGVSNYNVSNKLICECKGKLVILLTNMEVQQQGRTNQECCNIAAAQQVTNVRVQKIIKTNLVPDQLL